MRRLLPAVILFTLLFGLLFAVPVSGQESSPASVIPPLLIMTDYPSQQLSAGDTVTLDLDLASGTEAQIVDLELEGLPEGWEATFRGRNKVVQSAFVEPEDKTPVDLRIAVPASAEAGTYAFDVVARGEKTMARLPIELTVEEKSPAKLTFDVDLPTLRGKPDRTFRFNTTLKNEGDQDLTVDLVAEVPSGFFAVFKSAGQEITSLPLEAGQSERINVEVEPLFGDLTPAGEYPLRVRASGGDLEAEVTLVAEVVGESRLSLTTPDDRLSGDVRAGESNPLTLVLVNNGSAPARKIAMSASQPNGWTVTFDPEEVPEVGPGERIEVTADVKPNERALAGDYMLTFRAKPEDSPSRSIEYRATVRTSTIWGLVGIVLIAVAVGAVGLAVARFGRR